MPNAAGMNIDRLTPGKGGYQALTLTIIGLLVLGPLLSELVPVRWLVPVLFTAVLVAAVWSVSQGALQAVSTGVLSLMTMTGLWFELNSLGAAMTQLSGAACLPSWRLRWPATFL